MRIVLALRCISGDGRGRSVALLTSLISLMDPPGNGPTAMEPTPPASHTAIARLGAVPTKAMPASAIGSLYLVLTRKSRLNSRIQSSSFCVYRLNIDFELLRLSKAN